MYCPSRRSSSRLCLAVLVCLVAGVLATERGHQMDENQVEGTTTEQDCKTGQSGLHHCRKDTPDRNQGTEDVEMEIEEEKEEEAEGECGPTGVLMVRMQMQQMIHSRKEKIKEVANSFQLSKKNAEKARQDALLFANTLKTLINRGYQNTMKVLEEREKTEMKYAVSLITKLQEEVKELEKRGADLVQLSHYKAYSSHPKYFPGLCLPPVTWDWSTISIHADPMEGIVWKVTSELVELSDIITDSYHATEWERIRKCAVDVMLDPDTASPYLILSEDWKQVKGGSTRQNLPNHLKRFDPVIIVLGKPGFIFGRFYYEVQVMNKTKWAVGVAQESVTRKGAIVVSPERGYWAIALMDDKYEALDDTPALLDLSQKPQKVGVFVDCEKGTVSFYDAENGSLMYSYRGVPFTEKLYPFLTPFPEEDGLNSAPLVITPVSYKE